MFDYRKLLKVSLIFGLVMGFQLAMAQTVITTVFEGDEVAHHGVIQVLRGTGFMAKVAERGGDINPNDPHELVAERSVNGSLDQIFAGTTLVSQIAEAGEAVSPDDPDGLILAIRVHTAKQQATYILEQGGDIDLDDPDGLTPRTIVIHTREGAPSAQITVDEGPTTDPNDPDGLMAAEADGATLHRGLFGNTQVIIVVMPAPWDEADTPMRIRIYKTLL